MPGKKYGGSGYENEEMDGTDAGRHAASDRHGDGGGKGNDKNGMVPAGAAGCGDEHRKQCPAEAGDRMLTL